MNWQTILNGFAPGGNQGVQARQSEIDSRKAETARLDQEAQDRHAQHDLDFHDMLMRQGYKPSINGMVREDLPDLPGFSAPPPSGSDIPASAQMPSSVSPVMDSSILRPIDQSRAHTFKDHTGEPVTYEAPTTAEWLRMMKQRAAVTAQATSQGSAEGKSAADAENLQKNGVDLSDEDAARLGVPKGTRMLRSEISQLAGRVQPVITRVEGQRDVAATNTASREKVAGINADSRQGVADTNATSRENVAGVNASSRKDVAKINASKPGGRAGGMTPGQQGVQNRFQQRIEQNDAKSHEALQTKEQDLWAQHGAVGDVLNTPDGQVFADPKSGKEVTMNAAQRKVYQGRYNTIEAAAIKAKADAAKIRQKYSWGEFAPGSGNPSPAAPAAAPAANPASSVEKVRITLRGPDGKPYNALAPKANLDKIKQLHPEMQVLAGAP